MGGEKVSAAIGYGGSGTAVVFGLTPSEWSAIGVIGGLLIALAGFLVNAYFGWRRDQRERSKK
jgi:ABC-type proline/glycine betaine transport system permease subunit